MRQSIDGRRRYGWQMRAVRARYRAGGLGLCQRHRGGVPARRLRFLRGYSWHTRRRSQNPGQYHDRHKNEYR